MRTGIKIAGPAVACLLMFTHGTLRPHVGRTVTMAHGVARHTSATARLFLRLALALGASTLLLASPVSHELVRVAGVALLLGLPTA